MLSWRRPRSLVTGLSIAVLTWLLACSSSPGPDGASCQSSPQCASLRCTAGACEGSDCTCEGADCRGRSTCAEGWLCTRGDAITEDAISQCRQQCGGAFGDCPAGKRCDDGICRAGAPPFAITWLNIPRSRQCGSRIPCEYKVKVPEGTTAAGFTWTFGAAPPVQTTEPTTSTIYPTGGTFEVKVEARATTGAKATLQTTEIVCDGVRDGSCDPSGAPCCEGTCTAQRICK